MSVSIIRHVVDQQSGMEIMDVKDSHGRTMQFQCGILPGNPDPKTYFDKCIADFAAQETQLSAHAKNFKPRTLAVLILLSLLAPFAKAAPTVTVSASAVTLLGSTQSISITVQLIDPYNTGMLKVSGTGIVPIMRASTVTPGTTATVGPIYGNDVILNAFGVNNVTYYLVQVFTVTGGFVSSTPALQNFYAFTGSGTIDLVTATPLVPNFMNSTAGVTIPGNFSVSGLTSGNCVQAGAGGLLTTVSSPCNASGGTASSLTGPGAISGTFSGNHANTGVVTDSNASSTYAGTVANATTASNLSAIGPNPWFDVSANGADCTGVSDSTTALNSVITLASAKLNSVVRFPTGCTLSVSAFIANGLNYVTFDGGGGGSFSPTATINITGTCVSGTGCLQLNSSHVQFNGVVFTFPNCTTDPCGSLDGGQDIQFHSGGFAGPGTNAVPGSRLLLSVSNAFGVIFDGKGFFTHAGVFLRGPTNNSIFSDMVVIRGWTLYYPGVAAMQNASVNWKVEDSFFDTGYTASNCFPFLTYVSGYNQVQDFKWDNSEIIGNLAACTNAYTVFSFPNVSGANGNVTFENGLLLGSASFTAGQTLFSFGNNITAQVRGNIISLWGLAYSLGTGVTLNVDSNNNTSITTFLGGAALPNVGRVEDNAGKTTIYNGSAIYVFPSTGGNFNVAQTVVGGTASMTTALIGAYPNCGTVVTVSAPGVALTDPITFSNQGAVSTSDGALSLRAWPTTNNVNFQYCNSAAVGITPAAATVVWRVTR